MAGEHEADGRHLGIGAFLGLVVVYLAVLQGVGLLLAPDGFEYGEFPDVATVRAEIVIPVGLSLLLAVVVVSYLGWWRPVMREEHRTARWTWIVPVLLVVSILPTTNYQHLADQDTDLVLYLLVGTLLVGIGEELMFRGVGVLTFRRAGLTEGKVALWSSLVFGAVHASNIVTEGPSAFLQVLIVSVTGYFFYIARRASGTIVVPMLLHAFYDFSIFSSSIGPEAETSARTAVPLLVNIILAIVLVVRRHKIEAQPAPGSRLPVGGGAGE